MWSLTISSIIPLLIWGPFFPDLIVSLSSLIFLVYVFRNKLFFYFNTKPLIIFFIFCIYCILVSIFFAKDMFMSFESSLFYFRIGVFSCLICYLIDKDKKILDYFYYALVTSYFILIVDGYFQFIFDTNIVGIKKIGIRVSSFFGDELIMGYYLSRLFPLLFALFILKEKKNIEIYLMCLLFILVSGLILISGERNAFVLYILSIIFVFIFLKNFLKLKILLLIGSVIVIAILLLSSPSVKNRTATISSSINIKNTFVSPFHDSLFRTAYKMFLDKPVFGHGPKMYRIICKDKKYATGISPCMTHPHNFYLQLLAETGIVGFIFLFSVFIYVLFCAYRQFKSIVLRQKRYLSNYQICLLSGILLTVWPLTTNGNFFHNWLAIVYSLPFGFYLHSIYGKNKEDVYKNQH